MLSEQDGWEIGGTTLASPPSLEEAMYEAETALQRGSNLTIR